MTGNCSTVYSGPWIRSEIMALLSVRWDWPRCCVDVPAILPKIQTLVQSGKIKTEVNEDSSSSRHEAECGVVPLPSICP